MDATPREPTASLWEGLLQRASALRRRYANLTDGPQDTWSLVNRVAAEKFAGRVEPRSVEREELLGLWTRAMVSVLNDLYRRERLRPRTSGVVPEPAAPAEETGSIETMRQLHEALQDLARQDAAMGERKALLVALRYFEGMTWDELATALGSSVHRTRDEWTVTRAWLRRELVRRGVELEGGA